LKFVIFFNGILFYRYPGSLAWQLNLSRSQLRSSPELQRLKEFLYEQTEHVNDLHLLNNFFMHLFIYSREILVVRVMNRMEEMLYVYIYI
jgi:hypothetical protein